MYLEYIKPFTHLGKYLPYYVVQIRGAWGLSSQPIWMPMETMVSVPGLLVQKQKPPLLLSIRAY